MPRRYRLSLPLWCPAGGLPSLSPAYPAFSLFSCPLSPQPPSPVGKGETISIFRRGLRPRHPCIRPFAAFTEPAKQVPAGGLSLGVGGTRRGAQWFRSPAYPAAVVPGGGACPLCRLPPPPLTCFPAPYPPSPLPLRGRGGIKVIFMQGAPPLASPALDRLRHLQRLSSRCQAGGLPSLSPAYPAFSFLSCPLSPRPPSPAGKGETISLFRRGLRPRHPCIRPFAALTEPAKQVPGGGLAPRRWRHPAGALRLGRGTGEQCRQPRRGGTGGDGTIRR